MYPTHRAVERESSRPMLRFRDFAARSFTLLMVPLACSSIVATCGCGSKSAAPSERYIFALDRSESTDNFRAQQFSAIDTASYMAMANGAKIEIWCYDTHPKVVYGPTNPDQIQAVNAVKRDNMIPDPQHLRQRTRDPRSFWNRLSRK